MKKFTIILIVVLCLSLAGCSILSEVFNVLEEPAEVKLTSEIASPAPEEALDNVPVLPNVDFSAMDFFDDGYEIVGYSRTTDGDTASFIMGGINIKCRFVGINTPEIGRDGAASQPYGDEATAFTREALESAAVIILEADEAAGTYDNYDRLLAWVWVDGELLAFELVSNGLATTRYLYDDYKYADIIFDAEDLAMERGVGVWGK